ncbi:MAG: flavodoxin [Lachnospiraceae bacterium]|nr:flavodoxin [Lachnospiraceae bacterium]
MKKAIVIYKSKTGFTKRYAEWIGEALGCPAIPFKEAEMSDLNGYDTIIYGGGFYAGMISGIKWFKGNLPKWEGKQLLVFGTGASPNESPDIHKALKQNFTEEEWQKVKAFYMQAGLNYEKMSRGERMAMAVFRTMMKKSAGEDSEAYRMIQSSYDITDKELIKPLIESIK